MKGYPIDDERFAEDVQWFRSFKMNDEAVARRLGLSLNAFHKRISRARSEGCSV